ncbi:cupin domain-containing protein [Reinekea blandensis]|uniref:Cupin type-2 domain-containing protein n=1 Tax=Reinekea blandensis MED297 TaxID=314283 RepID=A4BID8_9GAMM|nr:cupin domain-containing protein [Reinekea blandensis]EAR08145.1 hypothetical protein MED297_00615 [Reinekea sp. MED297] [Reinekea blandensis MED297]
MLKTGRVLLCAALSLATAPAFAESAQQIVPLGENPAFSQLNQFFSGDVSVVPMFRADGFAISSVSEVTFLPGARTNWHSHPGGQVFIVTSGVGYTQAWGEPIQVVKAGDLVHCPDDVKHWHGASKESPMTHIALTGHDDEDGSVEWLEPVTDEQYNGPLAAQ